MDNEKIKIIGAIESASIELKSYVSVALGYVENNDRIPEVHYLGLIIEKMSEHIENLNNLFYENKIQSVL